MNRCLNCEKETKNLKYCSKKCYDVDRSSLLEKAHGEGRRDYSNMHAGAKKGWELRRRNGTDVAWNKGKKGLQISWCKGLSGDERVIERGRKGAETRKKLYREGKLKSWNRIPTDKLFIENCAYAMCSLRGRIKEKGLLKDECAICGSPPMWLGKPISLILDHINGIHSDSRLENLRWLCPNCNMQTQTWGRKNAVYQKEIAQKV